MSGTSFSCTYTGIPSLRSAAFGDADVVEVPVREDEGFDVVDCTAEASERRLERLPGGGNAGVDKGQSVIVFEQVEVGERVFDPVHSRRDVGVQGHADDPEEHGDDHAGEAGVAAIWALRK